MVFCKICSVDKCIRAQIVDPGSVARWIFSPEMGKYFNRFYIWEILHGTISKMNHHVHRVQDDYDNIVKRQQNSSVKMEEGMLFFEKFSDPEFSSRYGTRHDGYLQRICSLSVRS